MRGHRRGGGRGDGGGRPPWDPMDLFLEEGGYTTLAAAVSMLVVLALAFSAAIAVWGMSRAGDVRRSADATALAGANVVCSYATAATVVDACILSLSLTGLCVAGAGLAGLLVPGASVAAGEAVEAGVRMLDARNDFAESASRGLSALEASLPYLVAANAARTCAAQGGEAVSYSGVALAVPRESASEWPALAGEQVPTAGLSHAAESLDGIARELERASEESAARKERAWLADCGAPGYSMRERASRLSGLSAAQNPAYASSLTWEPRVGIERARAYYAWRRDHDAPEGPGVEAAADAAARHAFYAYACEELRDAYARERDGRFEYALPLLPRNTADVRESRLYTQAAWPTSREAAGRTLHYGASCPGATGSSAGAAALSDIDAGAVRKCPVCDFSVSNLGAAPAASTSIENGFEYHMRTFTLALADYAAARNRELELEGEARAQAGEAAGTFGEALSALSAKRPRIAPPGRYGCVALVVAGETETPSALDSAFNEGATVPRRGAIAAAVPARDAATRENNVLGSFFSGIEGRAGAAALTGIAGDLMGLWGDLLVSYGDLSQGLDDFASGLFDGLGSLGAGPVATWLAERVTGALSGLDLEPVDLSYRKPVLTDSAGVLARSDVPVLADAQSALRSVPLKTTDPAAIMEALGYRVGERIEGASHIVAEIPLPGGGSIPLSVGVRDLMGAT